MAKTKDGDNMAIPNNKTGFNFNHADQVDEYGLSVGDSSIVKSSFDSRAEEMRVFVNLFLDALRSTVAGDSGAESIGAETIIGVTGNTVHDQLVGLQSNITDVANIGLPANLKISVAIQAIATGATDSYVISIPAAELPLNNQQLFLVQVPVANTGSATLQINSETPLPIRWNDTNDVVTNMMLEQGWYLMSWRTTYMHLINPSRTVGPTFDGETVFSGTDGRLFIAFEGGAGNNGIIQVDASTFVNLVGDTPQSYGGTFAVGGMGTRIYLVQEVGSNHDVRRVSTTTYATISGPTTLSIGGGTGLGGNSSTILYYAVRIAGSNFVVRLNRDTFAAVSSHEVTVGELGDIGGYGNSSNIYLIDRDNDSIITFNGTTMAVLATTSMAPLTGLVGIGGIENRMYITTRTEPYPLGDTIITSRAFVLDPATLTNLTPEGYSMPYHIVNSIGGTKEATVDKNTIYVTHLLDGNNRYTLNNPLYGER